MYRRCGANNPVEELHSTNIHLELLKNGRGKWEILWTSALGRERLRKYVFSSKFFEVFEVNTFKHLLILNLRQNEAILIMHQISLT